MTDTLFEPLQLRDTQLPNRIMVSPMCQYSTPDGVATDWQLVHLGSRAVGGAGVVLTEATAVEPEGRISPADLGIWTDEQADALAPVAEFIESQGSLAGIQLAHAGRKASTAPPWDGGHPVSPAADGWEAVGPTDEPYPREEPQPTRRLTTAEVEGVVESFREAAVRAREAGFSVAEIHAAHGYLLHQFLSPVVNDREDRYGGSFAARTRLLREVTEAVREVWPESDPVFVRISGTDWIDDRESWTIEDSARLAPELAEAGADLIDVSSGGISPAQSFEYTGPGYQLALAERIGEALADSPCAVGTVGKITEPVQAEQIVATGQADAVLMAREFLRSPYWPLHAARELDATDEIDWPVQYRRAVQ